MISSSRFQPLAEDDEMDTEEQHDVEDGVEEGEILNADLALRRKGATGGKGSKKIARIQVGRAKDLKKLGMKWQQK